MNKSTCSKLIWIANFMFIGVIILLLLIFFMPSIISILLSIMSLLIVISIFLYILALIFWNSEERKREYQKEPIKKTKIVMWVLVFILLIMFLNWYDTQIEDYKFCVERCISKMDDCIDDLIFYLDYPANINEIDYKYCYLELEICYRNCD